MELKFFCKAFGIIKEDIVYDCRYVDDKYIIPKEKKEAKFMNLLVFNLESKKRSS